MSSMSISGGDGAENSGEFEALGFLELWSGESSKIVFRSLYKLKLNGGNLDRIL